MELEEAIEEALNGKAVVFVGAGFATGARNIAGASFKSGPELAKHFAARCGLPDDTGLEDAADEFVRQNKRDALIKEIHQEFTVKSIATHHQQIATIPWRRVYTTNYDNVAETAYAKAGRRLTPVTLADKVRAIPKADTVCVHLNGFVDRVTRDGVLSELKLTDTSYVTASIADSEWAVLLREDIDLARAVFFVGYSLFDLDIRRVVFETPRLREKCFFVLGPNPEPATARRVARYGSAVKLGVDSFAAAIVEKQRNYSPTLGVPARYDCFEQFEVEAVNANFSDATIFDLLLKGDVQPQFIRTSLHGDSRYYLKRKVVRDIIDTYRSNAPAVAIYSELGNGKTLISEGVKCEAARQGYSVYTLTRRTDGVVTELDRLLKETKSLLLVVDNYVDWLDVVDYFARHSSDDGVLLLTARTSVHDVLVDRLAEILGVAEVTDICVDLLSASDLEWLVDFFDEYGLWSDKASWSRSRKLQFLDQDLRFAVSRHSPKTSRISRHLKALL